MNEKKFDRLFQHYIRYFGIDAEPTIFHPTADAPDTLHIDVVHLKPTADRPYHVLATIGASDYRMKPRPRGLSNRNEYVTFVPAAWDPAAPEHRWILSMLALVAQYPHEDKTTLTYAHTIDLKPVTEEWQGDDFNMEGAGLLFPQAVPDTSILHCRTGLFETVTILHMMPLSRAEMETIIQRRRDGTPDWTDMFYPEEGFDLRFLCARKR